MAKRPEVLHDVRTVTYDQAHWNLLDRLRSHAIKVIHRIESSVAIQPFVHGSIARGDVSESSDIDIIIHQPMSSYKLELALGKFLHRELVQATPSMVLKGHLYLEDNVVVSFPIFKLRPREEEFYHWGGVLNLKGLEAGMRVPGVDKRLVLVEPSPTGHTEYGVIGHEHEVAKKLKVSVDIAKERVRVLTRRDNVGRTGVYLNRPLTESESFEEVAKQLQDSDPALRRTIERREGRRR
ncbi:MAG: nucleotidyltransferase domain-containing protein [Candidatus Thorarchaeota archaeon]|nr:nucleotidyltransferase domain-containing protein [Candidatus Thorarchaeota archaeon]